MWVHCHESWLVQTSVDDPDGRFLLASPSCRRNTLLTVTGFYTLRHLAGERKVAQCLRQIAPMVIIKSLGLKEGCLAAIVRMCGIQEVASDLLALPDARWEALRPPRLDQDLRVVLRLGECLERGGNALDADATGNQWGDVDVRSRIEEAQLPGAFVPVRRTH